MRVLVAEDEKNLNSVIAKSLKAQNYSVDTCFNGSEALDYIACAQYDVIILDIMMPKLSGIEVVKRIRSKNDKTPVLFLTARDSIEDRVTGLDAGADDYLVKPFALDELLARVRVLVRRSFDNVSDVLRAADLTLDVKSRMVKRGEVDIELTSKEFAILEYMLRNKGIVLSREQIEQHIWNYDYEGGTNVVSVYIRYLRKKVDDSFDKKLIHTVRGTGYVLKD